MAHFHGSVSGKHVHGDGSWAVAPAFGTITPAATSITFAHVGGGTHYRIYATGGSAGSFVSLPGSPVTVSGLTANTPYTLELSADGSTVAATTNTGTTNPATGGGEPTVPVQADFASTYSVRGSAQQDFAAAYSVIGTVQRDLAAVFQVVGTTQRDHSASYSVVGAVAQPFAAGYAVIGTAQRDFAAIYGVQASTQRDFSGDFEILGAGSVTASFPAAYQVVGTAVAEFVALNEICSSAQQDFLSGYNVIGSAQQSFVATYAISGGGSGAGVDEIVAAVMAALQATHIPVNVVKVNNVQLQGTGVPGDSMRPA